MQYDKPQWMIEHEASDERHFASLGKELADFRAEMRSHMEAIKPIIVFYEEEQETKRVVQRSGKKVLFWVGTITTLGAAYLMLKSIFHI